MATTLRLFVAVDPSPENLAAFRKTMADLRPHAPRARWWPPEKTHVTLAFLGSTEQDKLAGVIDAVRFVAEKQAPFVLRFEGGGTFGGKKRPRVLWAGIDGDLPALRALQRRLSEDLQSIGFVPEDREYSPHVTLARASDPGGDVDLAECAQRIAQHSCGEVTIREMVLYQSELSLQGSTYTVVLRQPFGA